MVTRKVEGHEAALIERFSGPRPSRMAEGINDSCFEALLLTATDRAMLARLFVDIGALGRPRATTRYCAEGIHALGELGITTVLEGIRSAADGPQRLRRARLLTRAMDLRLPQTPAFWKSAEPAEIEAAVDTWRDQLVARGLLRAEAPAPPVDVASDGAAESDAGSNGSE